MTVLAYKNGTLAADKRSTCAGKSTTVTKLFRVGDSIVGITGELTLGMQMVKWLENGAVPSDLPSFQNTGDYVPVLQARADGTLWEYNKGPVPYRIEDATYAMGSGRDYALAAMHLGQSAADAVRTACHFDQNCGNGVDEMHLAPQYVIKIDNSGCIGEFGIVTGTLRATGDESNWKNPGNHFDNRIPPVAEHRLHRFPYGGAPE